MDQILAALPKTFIAICALLIGLFVFRTVSPPRTVCDAQMELFRETQKKFLYAPAPVAGVKSPSLAKKLFDHCSNNNDPGGCHDLFGKIRKVVFDLENVPEQCATTAGEEPEIKEWVWKTMKLMVLMAWGERAPASYVQRNGWYDTSELSLFCSLRKHTIRMYGRERFAEWQEERLKTMPGAELLTREQIWQRNILSTSCDSYR